MSNDKDFEDDFEENAPDEMAGEDAGDDFVEEDWEAYDDEEQYIDDSDGDGGLAARRAAFNKFLIGGVVLLIAGGGAYFIMTGQTENLGLPKMQKISVATNVPADQKVEFHAETKVDAADPYGVKYGEEVAQELKDETKKAPQAGLLHNPEILGRIRKGETVTYEGAGDAAAVQEATVFKPGPELVETQPPMPLPILGTGQPEGASDAPAPDYSDEFELTEAERKGGPQAAAPVQTTDLLPLPRGPESAGAGMKETYEQAGQAGLESAARAEGDVLTLSGNELVHESAGSAESLSAAKAEDAGIAPARLPKTDMAVSEAILDRLDSMEASLQAMRGTMEDVENRLNRIEKKQGAGGSSPATSASRPKKPVTGTATARPAAVKNQGTSTGASSWVLRSAQPGQAMISRKGETDMKSVAIGDSLPGIGRITGVFVQDGKWVVQGVNGRITQ